MLPHVATQVATSYHKSPHFFWLFMYSLHCQRILPHSSPHNPFTEQKLPLSNFFIESQKRDLADVATQVATSRHKSPQVTTFCR